MRKILLTTALVLATVPAMAQEDIKASPEAFAHCAALAEASADQHRMIVKDEATANAMQQVANGYRAAALIAASKNSNSPQNQINAVIVAKKAEYAKGLMLATDVAADKFPGDSKACAFIEPQASQLIEDFNKSHAAGQP